MNKAIKTYIIAGILNLAGMIIVVGVLLALLVLAIDLEVRHAYAALAIISGFEVLTSITALIVVKKKERFFQARIGNSADASAGSEKSLKEDVVGSMKRRFLMELSAALAFTGVYIMFLNFDPFDPAFFAGIATVLLALPLSLLHLRHLKKRMREYE